ARHDRSGGDRWAYRRFPRPIPPQLTRDADASVQFLSGRSLLLDVALEHLTAHHGAVDITFRVDTDALSARVIGGSRLRVFDEGRDLPVPGASDTNSFLDAHELVRPRVRTRHGGARAHGH